MRPWNWCGSGCTKQVRDSQAAGKALQLRSPSPASVLGLCGCCLGRLVSHVGLVLHAGLGSEGGEAMKYGMFTYYPVKSPNDGAFWVPS